MAPALRSTSQSTANAYRSTLAVPVPAGSAAFDIAIVNLGMWESTNPTVTMPSGFALGAQVANGSMKIKSFWKRLAGAEATAWTFSWTGAQWSDATGALFTGCAASGTPFATVTTGVGSATTLPTLNVDSGTLEPLLAHYVVNESSSTGTPPTGYTEAIDMPYNRFNHRTPGASGVHAASGATISISNAYAQLLMALLPDPPAGDDGAFLPFLGLG